MPEPTVHKKEYNSTADHHRGDEVQVLERRINVLLEEEPEDDRRNNRNDQLYIKADPCKVEEFFIIDDHHSQDRKELDADLEQIRKRGLADPDNRVGEFHVSGRTNGQKFRQSFHDGQDDGLDDRHIWLRLGVRGYAWVPGLSFRKI